jgi:hypothetical protein
MQVCMSHSSLAVEASYISAVVIVTQYVLATYTPSEGSHTLAPCYPMLQPTRGICAARQRPAGLIAEGSG